MPAEQVRVVQVDQHAPRLIFVTTGRTTFVNTLCGTRVLSAKEADDAANAHLEEGVRIKPVTVGM